MAGFRCPVGFSEEIIDVFNLKNISNWHRSRQKIKNFQTLHAVFVKFMTDFVNWNAKMGQQGTRLLFSRLSRKDNCSLLSSSLLWRDNCSFLNENYPILTPKMRKNLGWEINTSLVESINIKFSMFWCTFCTISESVRNKFSHSQYEKTKRMQ